MNPPTYSRRAPAALILSKDPLGAALMGAALELLGYRASFTREGEEGTDALRRVKPRAVLVDAGDESLGGGVLGPAMMTGARLVLFGAAHRIRDLRVIAARYNASLLPLPDQMEKLGEILRQVPDAGRLSGG